MKIFFEKDYLSELFEKGKCSDKKHRFQPQIVEKYTKIIKLMMTLHNVLELNKFGGLHYEKLVGDMDGISSVRINNQYRIEFTEEIEEGQTIATICNIEDISNHYK